MEIKPLTEEQANMVQRAKEIGIKAACKEFNVTYSALYYYVDKDRRIRNRELFNNSYVTHQLIPLKVDDDLPVVIDSHSKSTIDLKINGIDVSCSIDAAKKILGVK